MFIDSVESIFCDMPLQETIHGQKTQMWDKKP